MATYNFSKGSDYTRADVFRQLGIRDPAGGPFYTGYAAHNGCWFIFCGVGTGGRTGHNYHNHFSGGNLVWYGKTNSALHQQSIQSLISPGAEVYVFYRSQDRSPFTFAGLARAISCQNSTPVQVTWELR